MHVPEVLEDAGIEETYYIWQQMTRQSIIQSAFDNITWIRECSCSEEGRQGH